MAVRKKSGKSAADGTVTEAIVSAVQELLEKHSGEIHRIREESEDKKVTVNFANQIDCSESEPLVTTTIRYTESYTDKITNRLDDPEQGTFSAVVEGAKSEAKKKRGKADGEPEA
jgi:molybdopterin converting factor small subunit